MPVPLPDASLGMGFRIASGSPMGPTIIEYLHNYPKMVIVQHFPVTQVIGLQHARVKEIPAVLNQGLVCQI